MAFTVTGIINLIVARYRDLDRVTALGYLQEVHTDLLTECRIVADTEDVTLVAGTRVYALDADILKVWGANLYKSATDSQPVTMTSLSDLDRYEGQWRTGAQAQPVKLYQEHSSAGARQIGVYPVPNATAIASYPTLRLDVARNQTLGEAVNTTSLPESVFDSTVYLTGVWLRHARTRHKEDIPEHLDQSSAAMAKLKGRETNLLSTVFPRNDSPFSQTARPR